MLNPIDPLTLTHCQMSSSSFIVINLSSERYPLPMFICSFVFHLEFWCLETPGVGVRSLAV